MKRQTGEWWCGDLSPDDLPAGKYLVSFRTWEKRAYFSQLKIRLDFVIVDPAAFRGILVSLYATCTLSPNKRHSRASKYYQLWVQANGGRPPKRGERMTASAFEGYWNVEVVWACNKAGEPTVPKIETLLERVAGGPV